MKETEVNILQLTRLSEFVFVFGSPSQVCTGVDIVEVVHLVRAVAQRRVALAVWVETVHLEIQIKIIFFVFLK